MSDPTPPSTTICEPWCTDADLPCASYELDPAVLEGWIMFASEVLFELSGGIYSGPCPVVARPCAQRRRELTSQWWAGSRGGMGACSCNRSVRCGCHGLSEVDLGPDVQSIDAVRVDGQLIDASEWELVENRYLVGWLKPDGTLRTWPCCQRLERPASGAGSEETFEVRFTRGLMPPRGGITSAASLTCELIAGSTGGPCRLPKRVTTITRQGVSVAVLDPLTLFSEGRTGLAEVDLWLESLRYGSAHREGVVIVPGRQQRYERRD